MDNCTGGSPTSATAPSASPPTKTASSSPPTKASNSGPQASSRWLTSSHPSEVSEAVDSKAKKSPGVCALGRRVGSQLEYKRCVDGLGEAATTFYRKHSSDGSITDGHVARITNNSLDKLPLCRIDKIIVRIGRSHRISAPAKIDGTQSALAPPPRSRYSTDDPPKRQVLL